MTKIKISFLTRCVAVLALASCSAKPTETSLYNIDSLLSAQINYLKLAEAKLNKHAVINGVAEDSVISDTSVWRKELEIFRELEAVNKPINRSNYIIDDGLYDVSSNLTVKAISANTDMPVKYIRVFYQESVARPRKIEAVLENKNSVYTSSRLLKMEFENIGNQQVMTAYAVEGGQKMIMGDSVMYTIQGKIIIN